MLGEGERNGVERKRSAPVAISFKLFFAVVGLTDYLLSAIITNRYLRNRLLTKRVVSRYYEDLLFYITLKEGKMERVKVFYACNNAEALEKKSLKLAEE